MTNINQQNIYAVIIAGGVGSRFWPKSRERSPKQVLEIIGSGSMIYNTVARIQSLIPPDKTLVVTNRLQKDIIHQQVPALPSQNILIGKPGENFPLRLARKYLASGRIV